MSIHILYFNYISVIINLILLYLSTIFNAGSLFVFVTYDITFTAYLCKCSGSACLTILLHYSRSALLHGLCLSSALAAVILFHSACEDGEGDILCECICVPLLDPVCQYLRGTDSNYYYSSLYAAVVTMATAGVRQQF